MCNGTCGGKMCMPMMIGKVLLIIGGLNWGIVGLGMVMGKGMDWNVVHMIFGSMPILEGIIYLLVGVAAIMKLVGCRCKTCMGGAGDAMKMGGGMDKPM